MIIKLRVELDDDEVFVGIPENERTYEMREYVRNRLEEYDGKWGDITITEALVMSARWDLETYLIVKQEIAAELVKMIDAAKEGVVK